ncbi:MAG TPA: CpsD/CapB family tyrosine-protein kinase [Terracidiphilus sp.]|jgi:capsular exopolysaccharide synthesis family protein
MSRLYEALQRADRERKIAPVSEDDRVIDPAVIPGLDEPPATTDAVLEETAQYSWSPAPASFPTLADRGPGVEQFRSLRSRIYQARYEAPLKTILISSGMPSEGKSFIVANLAMNLARNSVNPILLIDGDLRRPTLHTLLGAPNEPGLSEYLAGTAELKDILQRDRSPQTVEAANSGRVSNLTFIPAGKCGDNSAELVANHRIEELIATLSPHFDWILIDSPPVLAVTDAMELSRAADAVLLIARGARTPYDVAQRTQAAFTKSRILGFVLNDVKEVPGRQYSYYNYYSEPEAPNRAK